MNLQPPRMGCFGLRKSTPTVAVITIKGTIGKSVTFKKMKPRIDKAFSTRNLSAVCLVVDSGGGSPAQSELIARYLAASTRRSGVPLFAFAEDSAASGGYLIACAASKVFVSSYSMVGSIGAVATVFCASDLLARLGIRPVVVTAGERKAAGHPMVPPSAAQLEDLQQLADDLHLQFISWVVQQRGDRLPLTSHQDAFSGATFCGTRAVDLGLADATYNVMEETVAALLQEQQLRFAWIHSKFSYWRSCKRLVEWRGAGVRRDVMEAILSTIPHHLS